ncbi:quinol:cytochrome c oxidoreductase monoheme cytochrome subunit [Lutibacter oricola]|uniref:Quinol:cytochrome c oxidoreductase monoheme cytochrome subunit n=1 Tax=Lutibacter oricola TaxID=762486 RepID=A0A1H3EIN2_9FLAO|nr:cytochrome c [Lutibacter oricola]SDX78561.1 quinol:cytochrome c oxidoreductase monoheme cytochrome subunit [Lutibacter oricola]
MKNILKITIALAFVTVLSSCWGDKSKPNYQYMPDMYKSVGYETYSENPNFNNGMTTQAPAEGSIARGKVPYDYKDTNEGYEAAKLDLKSPLEVNEANLENGKKMYNIYCTSCHGKTGAGDGTLVQRDKFLGVPNYKDRDITDGSIYHVIMYGRNMMGSHASQLTAKERWQTTMYVQQLRTELLK